MGSLKTNKADEGKGKQAKDFAGEKALRENKLRPKFMVPKHLNIM